MNGLPSDFVMKEMARIATEQATESFAAMALEFAENIPSDVTGREALVAFSTAIRSTNMKIYGKGKGR